MHVQTSMRALLPSEEAADRAHATTDLAVEPSDYAVRADTPPMLGEVVIGQVCVDSPMSLAQAGGRRLQPFGIHLKPCFCPSLAPTRLIHVPVADPVQHVAHEVNHALLVARVR